MQLKIYHLGAKTPTTKEVFEYDITDKELIYYQGIVAPPESHLYYDSIKKVVEHLDQIYSVKVDGVSVYPVNKVPKHSESIPHRADLLDKAKEYICQDRNAQYGSPENSFGEIAKVWSWWLNKEITAHDVGVMMGLFKAARIKTGGKKDDNYIDACGYFACAGEINNEELLK